MVSGLGLATLRRDMIRIKEYNTFQLTYRCRGYQDLRESHQGALLKEPHKLQLSYGDLIGWAYLRYCVQMVCRTIHAPAAPTCQEQQHLYSEVMAVSKTIKGNLVAYLG